MLHQIADLVMSPGSGALQRQVLQARRTPLKWSGFLWHQSQVVITAKRNSG